MTFKKIVACAVILMAVFSIFAEDEAMKALAEAFPSEKDYTEVENITIKNEEYVLKIIYYPATDEAYFIYETPAAIFDQGAAMNIIHVQAMAFQESHSYYSYVYSRKDVTRYDLEDDTAIYTSYIQFSK
ncbi:MAG: hypothetical protein KBT02_07100 [Treponema sp.]|nr:hypothetical protein [Candidatus Treponema caballi]